MRLAALSGGLCLLWAVPAGTLLLRNNYTLPWFLGSVLPCYFAGLFAWWHAPSSPVARRLLLIGIWLSVGIALKYSRVLLVLRLGWGIQPATGLNLALSTAGYTAGLAVGILIVRLLALLPDGQYRFGHERLILVPLWGGLALPAVLALAKTSAQVSETVLSYYPEAWLPVMGALLLVVRCVRALAVGRPAIARLLTTGLAFVVILLGRAVCRLFRTWTGDNGILFFLGATLGALPYVLISVWIVYAGLRHRLLGHDIVIRRSLQYGMLSLIISVWYLGMAMTLGLTVSQYLPIGLAVLIAVGATVLFQPLRVRLYQLAERRIFGPRLTSFELLMQFGLALEHAHDLGRLAPQLAVSLQQGLNVTWARVRLYPAGMPAATGTAGTATDTPPETHPICHGDDALGEIAYGTKVDGSFTQDDRDVVATLARQVALTVHNTRLTAELSARVAEVQRQAEELNASRARIVHAQDTERRRIERRLHDGLQQELVALVAKLRLARNRLARGDSADLALKEAQDDAYTIIDELREIAHGIHPPVLTDQGLLAALTSLARRMPIEVNVHGKESLGDARFALDIEEATFYVVSEALTNVLKHANATVVDIHVSTADGCLAVEVRDDGGGFSPDSDGGSGLTGMRDRAEAVGGELTVSSRPGTGTVIQARLTAVAREEADAQATARDHRRGPLPGA